MHCAILTICRVCSAFRDALAVKIGTDLLKGLWSYGGFKLRGSGSPKFSAPLAAKLYIRDYFRCAGTCLRSSITMPSLYDFAAKLLEYRNDFNTIG